MPKKALTKIERCKTGVPGLDELLGGGIPYNHVITLSGTCGTGKTLLGLKYLLEGTKQGEAGIYFSFEQDPKMIINDMLLFGWNIDKLISDRKLLVSQPELYNWDNFLNETQKLIEKYKAKRIVMDSISLIGMYFKDEFDVRKNFLSLFKLLKGLGCTSILISEIEEGKGGITGLGIEEFISDGVTVMYYLKEGNAYSRAITVRKMRSTEHSRKMHPMKIKVPEGVIVYPAEELIKE
ncbi:MAG: hypothetical protein JW834_04965 [Candidatus Diapherotrites archaeon]|nr:hypothetical protein [Candidatus Diapherotrites archaeon]